MPWRPACRLARLPDCCTAWAAAMISHIDHIVLTVRDSERSVTFYSRVLGMEAITFGEGRRALRFGNQKINLQTLGMETRNHAVIGSGDLCLVTEWPPEKVIAHLKAEGVEIDEGPVERAEIGRAHV